MFTRCSTLAALAMIAVLAAPAGAQTPSPWTQAGMLRCVVNPEHRLHHCWPPVDGM